jgi:hypothetical protein
MSDDPIKSTPGAVPNVPGELADQLAAAIDDPAMRAPIRLTLHVEGGLADERYEFHFEASGAGVAHSVLRDALTGRAPEPKQGDLTRAQLTDLLSKIDVRALAEAGRHPPRFPPDSLVGRLEVGSDTQHVSVLFMADPEQARSARQEPPRAVRELVAAIYEAGAKQLGEKTVAP